ncbi:polyprenyl synthetase [Halosimplex pelagicum]|uniref:Polyprenyl synthetase n=1 Tax=Halosimplex pelagicum TaxID=869886 RepID=A0A7D5PDL9_9EURY|nr:polyprenyl synthetase [Halosimplex pelagicum]QLH84645.1 polyprenyl synthetase [Halosimplex pelagicum]
MTPTVVPRSAIESHLESALDGVDGDGLALARETVEAAEDRWYGQLVAGAYRSLPGRPDTDRAVPAAAAVELVRGYCRLRSELLVQLTDSRPHAFTRDEVAALLAGDYLYTGAYSALAAADRPDRGDCFETVTDALEAVSGAFVDTYVGTGELPPDRVALVERTAGRIGETAAVLGARLADADDRHLDPIARAGRSFAAARTIRRALDREPGSAMVAVPERPAERLGEHATRRREAGRRALGELQSSADVSALRRLGDAQSDA